MDTGVLEEFVTLSIVRNFSIAAEQLHISQPSLSRHIRQLEDEMGAQLVERSSPLMLTVAGQKVLSMATAVLSTIASAKREIASGVDASQTTRLQIEDTYYCPCFSEFMYLYAQEAHANGLPNLQVSPIARGKTAYECVSEGILDYAFASSAGIEGQAIPFPQAPEGLVAEALPHSISRICFLAHKDHPLAQKNAFTLADLAHTNVLMPTMVNLNYDRICVQDLTMRYAGFAVGIDWRQVGSMQEFFSLDPGNSVFFTTRALAGHYQQYSTWVLDSTVKLFPTEAPYVRQLFLVHRSQINENAARAIQKIKEIWGAGGYYGDSFSVTDMPSMQQAGVEQQPIGA